MDSSHFDGFCYSTFPTMIFFSFFYAFHLKIKNSIDTMYKKQVIVIIIVITRCLGLWTREVCKDLIILFSFFMLNLPAYYGLPPRPLALPQPMIDEGSFPTLSTPSSKQLPYPNRNETLYGNGMPRYLGYQIETLRQSIHKDEQVLCSS